MEADLRLFEWSEIDPTDDKFTESGRGGFGSVVKARWGSKAIAVKLLNTRSFFSVTNTEFNVATSNLNSEVVAQVLAAKAVQDDSESGQNLHVVHVWGTCTGPATPRWLEYLGNEASSFIRSDQLIAIVLAWADGGTLHEALHGSFSGRSTADVPWARHATLANKLRVLCHLARTLQSLHFSSRRIVHGDLKPANILFNQRPTTSGSEFVPLLTDFGLAKIKKANPLAATSVTSDQHTDRAQGTVAYMAPEQFSHSPDDPTLPLQQAVEPGRSTDVHAFGTIMWEVLTGQQPWAAWPYIEIRRGKAGGRLPGTATYPVDVPSSVQEIIHACLAADSAKRPRMDVVLAALEQSYSRVISDSYDIFLSYCWGAERARQPLAVAVYTLLTKAGYRVWLDRTQMGANIEEDMKKGIAASRMAILLVSCEYVARPNCKLEWQTVLSLRKP